MESAASGVRSRSKFQCTATFGYALFGRGSHLYGISLSLSLSHTHTRARARALYYATILFSIHVYRRMDVIFVQGLHE